VTMHGGITVTKSFKRRMALRWAMRRSNATVVVSAATQKQFAEDLGLEQRAFHIVHNGVPVTIGDATRVRQEFGCGDRDVVILAVGTLERNKGHHLLLEALVQLGGAAARVPWRLIVAGGRGGDQHQPLLEYVRANGLEDRVHIVTGRGDIADLLALASVFAMPSLWEGLPMAVLEAMVAGKAIVASATGGIPEAIMDRREGLLVPPGDVRRLSDALGELLADPQRRSQFGAAARARAQRDFVASVMAERYESLYRQAHSQGKDGVPA
jgi:glycosyltransferase involved in cell wall biosynthesis